MSRATLRPTHPFRRCEPTGPHDHRLRLEAVDPNGDRLALATVDRLGDGQDGELTLELAPGCHDAAIAAELVRRTAIAATIDGVRRLVARYDRGRSLPAEVLGATNLTWQVYGDDTEACAALTLPPDTGGVP